MATTPFTYNGASFLIDDRGTILNAAGAPLTGNALDAGVQAAAAQAVAGASGATTLTPPAAAAPALNSTGTVGEPAYSIANPPPPAAAPVVATPPALPATPPRQGVGSDTTNRTARDAIQKQIDAIMATADPKDGTLTGPQYTAVSALNARATELSKAISTNESKPQSSIVSGTVTPNDRYIVREDPENPGKYLKEDNPAWNGKPEDARKPETHTVGNNLITIGADGSMTSTLVNAQGQANEDRVAAAQGLSANASALNAQVNDFAARAKAAIELRVANGDTAEQARQAVQDEYTQLHQQWVEADGEAKRAQTALDAANAERHLTVRDTQADAAAKALEKSGERQSADTRYGHDTSAATNKYTTDASSKTARLNAANSMMQNSLSTLAEINKTLPPGSTLAGEALEGMLRYGEKFLKGFANDENAPADPNAPKLPGDTPTPSAAAATPATDPNAAIPAWKRADDLQTKPDPTTGNAAPGTAGTVPRGAPNYMGLPESPAALPQYMYGAGPGAVNAGGPPDATATLMASNAAAHQATMAAPVGPDGSPYATPDDVSRIYGRRGGMGGV